MIPKIIWQTHKWEYKDLPDIYKQTSLTWQKMNPDWEYRYIPNSKIRKMVADLNIKSILDFFDDEPTAIGKSDIYRELMVWAHGGIWADMDSVCVSPIDKTIEKNEDKEMICSRPVFQFGMDPDNDFKLESTQEAINKILSGIECKYWIPNNIFIGKKNNIVSEEIVNSMCGNWNFETTNFMGVRAELYDKHYKVMSLDLVCGYHDSRFNHKNY